MKLNLVIIGLIMMLSPLLVKKVPALLFLGPFLSLFFLAAIIGFIIFCVGISKKNFTNVQPITLQEEKDI
jgi:hypothetical protein